MNLGVSTLGCPDWTLEEIAARLPAYGYEGVELRGLGPDLDLAQSPHFASPSAAARSRRILAEVGLQICGVDTSCQIAQPNPEARTRMLGAAREAIDLAAALGAPVVRVFGGEFGEAQTRSEAAWRAADALRDLGEWAVRQTGGAVSVALETHDAFSTGQEVADVLGRAAQAGAGALWDGHHPFRQGEPLEETFGHLRPYLKAAHVKDSVPGGTYCLLGEGDIPVKAMLRLLRSGGYEGWITLEWEKRWVPSLLPPEVVFPQYATRLRAYLEEETS